MKKGLCLILLISFLLPSGCSKKIVPTTSPVVLDGRYDTEFPNRHASDQLDSISRSIKKLYSVIHYQTFIFKEDARITRENIVSDNYKKSALSMTITPESVSATATIIYHNKSKVALLTCAHPFDFPDTLLSFYPNDRDKDLPGNFIKSLSLKVKHEIYVKGLAHYGSFAVLAMDRTNDIAIIGKHCEGLKDKIDVFKFPRGYAKSLGWGCFVYIFGYPMGNLMLTRGIVSEPNSDESGTFMTDALFNKGCSGGLILAIRDGIPNFELVGMIRSAYSRKEYTIMPERGIDEYRYNESQPYDGQLYVKTSESIIYGVTYAASMEILRSFYEKNRKELILQGYVLDDFFR